MKVQTVAVDEIERIGVAVDQAFTINFDSKMAKILADGLYSDKVQSVIRELSCNAWDSHVEAKKANQPFAVHFPTTLEPWFAVQDFGLGLSHEQVMDIYTRYGASTKTNSNDVIGQLGLGSKSPFALTNAFDVTTRKDGVENHYSMYRNEKGMPCVAQLGQNLTNEPNGVTVRVPVRAELRREFMDKAREVYKWFPVPPRVEGIDDLGIKPLETAYEGTGWRILKMNRDRWGYGNSQRPVALMGMVAYPLEAHHIHGLKPEHHHMLSLSLVLDFNIGDLEVAANREALGYDERTIQNITDKLDVLVNELGAQFEQKIASAATEFEARKRFGEIFGYGREGYNEFRNTFMARGLKWKGKVIKEDRMRVQVTDLYPLDKDKHATDLIHFCNDGYKRPRRQIFGTDSLNIQCDDKTRIYFNDVGLGGLTRVHQLNKDGDYSMNIFVFGAVGNVTQKEISKALGGAEVLLVSSLPKPARAAAPKRTNILEWTGGTGKASAWKQVEIDLNDGGYYVTLDGWDVRDADGHLCDLTSMKWNAVEAGLIQADTRIFAMRGKNRSVVSDDPDWKEFFSTVKEEAEAKILTMALSQYLADQKSYLDLSNSCGWAPWDRSWDLKVEISPMREFVQHVREVKDLLGKPGKEINALQYLANHFHIDLGTSVARYDLASEWRVILANYPMLEFVENRYYGKFGFREERLMNDYVNHVDISTPFMRLIKEEDGSVD